MGAKLSEQELALLGIFTQLDVVKQAQLLAYAAELLLNNLISNITYKKYGMPFNDTEICAFRVFHVLSESNLKLSDYIKLYVSAVNENEEAPLMNKKQKELK